MFRPGEGWTEQVVRIPAQFIERSPVELELTGRYASFYYWFFRRQELVPRGTRSPAQ